MPNRSWRNAKAAAQAAIDLLTQIDTEGWLDDPPTCLPLTQRPGTAPPKFKTQTALDNVMFAIKVSIQDVLVRLIALLVVRLPPSPRLSTRCWWVKL